MSFVFCVVLYFAGYAGFLYLFYALCPILLKMSSATILGLCILSANIYNLLFGIVLFNNVVCDILSTFVCTQ